MLQEIRIANVASYSDPGESLVGLKPINFIFGTNGAGKTTISRLIHEPEGFPSCALTWFRGRQLQCFVYNSDFVARTYQPQLPGIFTLGESASDTLEKIDAAKRKVTDLADNIAQLNQTLGQDDGLSGKRGELRALRAQFEVECWKIKTKHDQNFKEAFSGVRNSQARFCDRVLSEAVNNSADVVAIDELTHKAETLFDTTISRHDMIDSIDLAGLINIEAAPVLVKNIVGQKDVDVAALIQSLGNSDWVRQGLSYLGDGSQCPFCQQAIEAELARKLNEYFDETYLKDVAAVSTALETYEVLTGDCLTKLQEISELDTRHLNRELLKAEIDRLSARIAVNKRLLEGKKREPSSIVRLEPVWGLAEPIIARIAAANTAIAAHNSLVENLAAERNLLVAQIWRALLDENSALIARYLSDKEARDRAVQGLTAGIAAKKGQLAAATAELRELEKSVTSVEPTVSAINNLLSSFGFAGFRLRTAGDRNHLYEITRDDGEIAADTLSEGEKSFVCFLYFYHLLRGSMSESDVTTDRIVVFDDPVSSLDSDVLFIVSALIKRALKEACDQTGHIKQIFVLTHNVYFHKEVSFDPNRGAECRNHETFWIVKKREGKSSIGGFRYNPIKTSYELLWSEVRDQDRSNLTIQNTLRRIIENYFKILGSVDTDQILSHFEGRDQQICASLFSWVNDGSHSAHEDFYISVDESVVARYLDVFHRIFEKTGHEGHYQMMMGARSAAGSTAGAVALAALG